MSKKKGTKVVQMPQSPENYFKSGRARKLPIRECLITENWQESGIANVLVARNHVNGHISHAVFLVDLYCLGIKNVWYRFNDPESEYEDLREDLVEQELAPCNYLLAHNIIYGAMDYAWEYGFVPHKDFSVAEFILEDDDENVDLMDIEFGKDGKPFYVAGPHDNKVKINRILSTLERTAGKGNYDFLLPSDETEKWDEESEEWDEEDKPLFEEGEMEDIMQGKKEADLFQSFIIADSLYEHFFPEEKSAVGIRDIDDLDIEELLDKAIDEKAEYYPASEQEAAAIEKYMAMPDDSMPEDRVPVVEKAIARFPHVYPLYQLCLVLFDVTKKTIPGSLFDGFYRKFPGTPLSKILRASQLINEGKAGEVFQIFGENYKLEEAFPEREGKFFADEIFSFYAAMCCYYTAVDDIGTARIFAKCIVEYDIMDDASAIIALSSVQQKMQDKVNASIEKEENIT